MKAPYLDNLDGIDFSLKEFDPVQTKYISPGKGQKFKVYVGNVGWNERSFIPRLYPLKTKRTDYLKEYSRLFNSVVVNSTKFDLPAVEEIEKWKNQTPNSFKFSFKIPHFISHQRKIDDDDVINDYVKFIEKVSILDDKLGIFQFGFSAGFSPKRISELYNLLEYTPENIDVAIGLRHADFFKDRELMDQVTETFAGLGISYAFYDTPERRDILHLNLSTSSVYIEINGSKLHPTDFVRANNWVDKICEWKTQGLQNVYFYVSQSAPLKHTSYDLIKHFSERLNEKIGQKLVSVGSVQD